MKKLTCTLDMIKSFSVLFMDMFSNPPKSCAMLSISSVAQYFDWDEEMHIRYSALRKLNQYVLLPAFRSSITARKVRKLFPLKGICIAFSMGPCRGPHTVCCCLTTLATEVQLTKIPFVLFATRKYC